MAVAIVGSLGQVSSGSGVTRTVAYTVDAAGNFILARVHWIGTPTLSGVSYNGNALTSIGLANGGEDHNAQMLRLVSPPTGSSLNLVATWSADPTFAIVTLQGYSGVDTTTPTSSFQSGQSGGGASPASIAAVTSAVDDMVINAFTRDDSTAITAQNQTQDYVVLESNEFCVGAGGHADGASSVDPEWTYTGLAAWAMCSVNVKASAGGGGETGQPTMRRWGGVPHMGGFNPGSSIKGGGSWARRRSGIYVPPNYSQRVLLPKAA